MSMDAQDRGKGHEGPHLDAEEVASYVDGRLADDRRGRVESHLADCDECREEVVSVARGLEPPGARRFSRWLPLVAAAGLAGILTLRVALPGQDPAEGGRLRSETASLRQEGVPGIEVIEPENDAVVARDALRFAWRAPGSSASYRLTLTDTGGDVLWRGDTRDTALTLPPDVVLLPGSQYFWYVDTLLETGLSATTDIMRFSVARGPP